MLFHGTLFELALFEIPGDSDVVEVVAAATLTLRMTPSIVELTGRTPARSAIGSVGTGSVAGRIRGNRPPIGAIGFGSVSGKVRR